MTLIKRAIIVRAAAFTRAHDIPGTLRFARMFYPPGRSPDESIRTIIDYDNGVRMNIDTRSFLEWLMFFKGHYDFGLARLVRVVVRPGDVVVDVGTNVGQYALPMCQAVGERGAVYMFEPQPEVRERLQANVALNDFRNAVVSSSAIGDRSGTAELSSFLPGETNEGNATLLATGHPDLARSIPVTIETLDDAALRLGLSRVDFLKVETQGNDVAALDGAAQTIKKFRPCLTVRYDAGLYKNAGTSYKDIKAIFKAHRYRDHVVTKNGLLPLADAADAPAAVIYAVPEERITMEHPQGFQA